MRKNLLLISGCIAVTSCGVSSSSVRGTVAIEKNCPKENVRILEKVKTMGRGLYSVEACGEVYTYGAWGNMIFEDKQITLAKGAELPQSDFSDLRTEEFEDYGACEKKVSKNTKNPTKSDHRHLNWKK